MRILANKTKVFGFDELNENAKEKAKNYFIMRKQEELLKGKNFYYTVNDFEFYQSGNVFFYTHNILAY